MERGLHLAAALLNRGIQSSATARAQADALEGQSLGLRLRDSSLRLRIVISDNRAGVVADDRPADVELTGGPLDFQRLALGEAEDLLRSGAIEVRGDAETAERFRELLQSAGPDFEELMSRILGDVAAHELGEIARGFTGWANKAAQSMGRSLTEYLQEERRDTPTRFELDEFLADVDALSNDVERAAARVARLSKRLHT